MKKGNRRLIIWVLVVAFFLCTICTLMGFEATRIAVLAIEESNRTFLTRTPLSTFPAWVYELTATPTPNRRS